MSDVSIVKCKRYKLEELEKNISLALGALQDLPDFKNKKILIKPNFLAPNSAERAVTTHPIFIHAVIRVLKRYTPHIYLGDSPGIGTLDMVLRALKLKEILIEEGVEIVDFKTSTIRKVNGEVTKQFTLAKIVDLVDMVVSLPKLKTHGMTYYTGAIKNQFGLVPGLLKPKQHYIFKEKSAFSHMLLDLHLAVKPALAIMDAVVGMEGNGPRNGTPREIGCILAATDFLALDATACRIINLIPEDIVYLKLGAERKLGCIDTSAITYGLAHYKEFVISDFKHIAKESQILDIVPKWRWLPLHKVAYKLMRIFWLPHPKLIKKQCVGCRECEIVCPSQPKSIHMENGKPVINKKSCIRCFCCQEMCPVGALKAKRGIW